MKLKLFGSYNIFFIKVSKTENRFKTGFQQPKTGLQKKPVLASLVTARACRRYHQDGADSLLYQKPLVTPLKIITNPVGLITLNVFCFLLMHV